MADETPRTTPEMLDRYELIALLARGGMGAVHLARLLLDRQAFDTDMAGQRLLEAGDAAHQCGFASAVGADECRHAARSDGQAHAVEGAVARIFKHQL